MVDFTVFIAKNAQNSLIGPKNFLGLHPLTPNMELRHWTTLRAVHCDPKQVQQGAPSHFCLIFHFFVSEICLNSLLG